jgi:putative flippase GtrA
MSAGNSLLFVRYTLVGGLATIAQYVVLVALVELAGMNAGISSAAGAGCGALVAYQCNRRFTFPGRSPHRQALPRFLAVAALGVLLNASVVWSGTELLELNYLIPQVIATALVLAAGFTLNRSWSFA